MAIERIQRRVLGMATGDNRFGSYYHRHLAVHFPKSVFETARVDVNTFLKEEPDPAKRLSAAVRDVAVVHELRHFHDCFGTFAGITVFLDHLARLRSFVEVCEQIVRERGTWTLPINAWMKDPCCPDYVREFEKRLVSSEYGQMVFDGAFNLLNQQRGIEPSWDTIMLPHGAEAAALRLEVPNDACLSYDSDRGQERQYWVPIGFEALAEGNAQAVQVYFLERHWPRDVVEYFKNDQLRNTFVSQSDESPEALGVAPYRLTEILLTDFLKSEHNISIVPGNWITKTTDSALMFSAMSGFNKGTYYHPGIAFLRSMTQAAWPKSGGVPNIRELERTDLQEFAASVRSIAGRTGVSPEASVVEYLADYACSNIISPMLDIRIQQGGAAFWDLSVYAKLFSEFPQPPMLVDGDTYRKRRNSDDVFGSAWSRYVMLLGVAEQIWSGATVIHCPRAHAEMVPGLASFEMSKDPPGCTALIQAKRCMNWDAGRTDPLPRCYFERLTRVLGLVRPNGALESIKGSDSYKPVGMAEG